VANIDKSIYDETLVGKMTCATGQIHIRIHQDKSYPQQSWAWLKLWIPDKGWTEVVSLLPDSVTSVGAAETQLRDLARQILS
jgi:hypothetical protein